MISVRAREDEALQQRIRTIHDRSRQTYGAEFAADKPNTLWIADIPYVPTWMGFLHLAVIMDVWSRKIVGWAMASHLRTSLVIAALDMAIVQRSPEGVIFHSDQGCRYTSIEFGKRCHEAGVRPSMGSVGDCYDNAMCESFFATLECELIDRSTFRTHEEARDAIFDFIEGFFNTHRRHSALGNHSPVQFEKHQNALMEKLKTPEPAFPTFPQGPLPLEAGRTEHASRPNY
jgi:transposase InsO family protein